VVAVEKTSPDSVVYIGTVGFPGSRDRREQLCLDRSVAACQV
jgi:hypothetical protein